MDPTPIIETVGRAVEDVLMVGLGVFGGAGLAEILRMNKQQQEDEEETEEEQSQQ
jgi:hypothetical protein